MNDLDRQEKEMAKLEAMLKNLDLQKTGELFRQKRKEKKLRLEDVAGEKLSMNTVSRVENGKQILKENFLYICHQLDIPIQELPQLVTTSEEEKQKKEETLLFQLQRLDTTVRFAEDQKDFMKSLDQLDIREQDPLYIYIPYLKGKYYHPHDERAKPYYLQAIQFAEKYPVAKQTNIHAASYCELGRYVFFQNNFPLALEYTEKGIQAFIPEGKREQTIYVLLANKAMYLEQLDQLQEASDTLEKLFHDKGKITHIDVRLQIYDLKAKILLKGKMYREAKTYAEKGIYHASLNQLYTQTLSLYTTLGSIYRETGELSLAEDCFLIALQLETKVPRYTLFRLYHQLGLLYLQQGRTIRAQKTFERALRKKPQQIVLMVRYNQINHSLGDCLYQQDMYKEALEKYEKSLQFINAYKLEHQKQEIQWKIGQCLRHLDKQAFYEYIETIYEKGEDEMMSFQLTDDPASG